MTKPCIKCSAPITRWQPDTPIGNGSWGRVRYCPKCRTIVGRDSIKDRMEKEKVKRANAQKIREKVCSKCGKGFYTKTTKLTCVKCS